MFEEGLVLRYFISVVCLGITCGVMMADKIERAPKEAKTTDDILKKVEKGFGTLHSVEFKDGEEKTFIVWYNPYSGRAACHLHSYQFDEKKKQWVMDLDRVFEGTHHLSVEVGELLTIRDVKGKVIYKEKAKE